MDSNRTTVYSPIFSPKNIAVFYQSKEQFNRGKLGIEALLFFGFKGEIFPINEYENQIQGLAVYPSLKSIPTKVDLAILDVQDTLLVEKAFECARNGVRGIVIPSSIETHDIAETGDERKQKIMEFLIPNNTRLIGPVSSGIYSPAAGLTSCFGSKLSPESGSTGIFAEQGLEIGDICYASMGRDIKFSTVVSVGKGWDIDSVEMIRYFESDNNTRVIGGYIDKISDYSSLNTALRQCSKIKPTVIFHPISPRTAASSSQISSADFIRSTGAIHTSNFHDFVNCLMVLNCFEEFSGNNVGVIAEENIFCLEGEKTAIDYGFFVPKLDKYTLNKIKEYRLSINACNSNPVESVEKQQNNTWLLAMLDVLSQNPTIDFIVMQHPTRISQFQQQIPQQAFIVNDSNAEFTSTLIKKAKEIYKAFAKHLIMILPETSTSANSEQDIEDRFVSRKQFCINGIPCFDSFKQAFSVLSKTHKQIHRIG